MYQSIKLPCTEIKSFRLCYWRHHNSKATSNRQKRKYQFMVIVFMCLYTCPYDGTFLINNVFVFARFVLWVLLQPAKSKRGQHWLINVLFTFCFSWIPLYWHFQQRHGTCYISCKLLILVLTEKSQSQTPICEGKFTVNMKASFEISYLLWL